MYSAYMWLHHLYELAHCLFKLLRTSFLLSDNITLVCAIVLPFTTFVQVKLHMAGNGEQGLERSRDTSSPQDGVDECDDDIVKKVPAGGISGRSIGVKHISTGEDSCISVNVASSGAPPASREEASDE